MTILGSKLARIVMLSSFLGPVIPSGTDDFFREPVTPGRRDDKQEFSECHSCVNQHEKGNMCNASRRFPSGICAKYEGIKLEDYNRGYGPKVEGMEVVPVYRRKKRSKT